MFVGTGHFFQSYFFISFDRVSFSHIIGLYDPNSSLKSDNNLGLQTPLVSCSYGLSRFVKLTSKCQPQKYGTSMTSIFNTYMMKWLYEEFFLKGQLISKGRFDIIVWTKYPKIRFFLSKGWHQNVLLKFTDL